MGYSVGMATNAPISMLKILAGTETGTDNDDDDDDDDQV